MTKSGAPCLQSVEQVGGIKIISLGNNNHHHISVAAKIILLSLAGCLTSRMLVNPPTFYLVCVKAADYLLPTHVWPSVATSNRQETLFHASCISRTDIKAIETKVELDHRNNQDNVIWWLIFMRSSREHLTNISSWLEGGTEAAVDICCQSWSGSTNLHVTLNGRDDLWGGKSLEQTHLLLKARLRLWFLSATPRGWVWSGGWQNVMKASHQLGRFYLTGDHNGMIETRADIYVWGYSLDPLLHRQKWQNISWWKWRTGSISVPDKMLSFKRHRNAQTGWTDL